MPLTGGDADRILFQRQSVDDEWARCVGGVDRGEHKVAFRVERQAALFDGDEQHRAVEG